MGWLGGKTSKHKNNNKKPPKKQVPPLFIYLFFFFGTESLHWYWNIMVLSPVSQAGTHTVTSAVLPAQSFVLRVEWTGFWLLLARNCFMDIVPFWFCLLFSTLSSAVLPAPFCTFRMNRFFLAFGTKLLHGYCTISVLFPVPQTGTYTVTPAVLPVPGFVLLVEWTGSPWLLALNCYMDIELFQFFLLHPILLLRQWLLLFCQSQVLYF